MAQGIIKANFRGQKKLRIAART